MSRHYVPVARRAGHRCEYCLAPEAAANQPFQVEHIEPFGRGGTDDTENLALSCGSCNTFKSDKTDAFDPLQKDVVRLFNPRQDRWEIHFKIGRDGELVGQTATGRATIGLLRMNSVSQRIARRHWIRLGLYHAPPPR
jgi:hypothetical protein